MWTVGEKDPMQSHSPTVPSRPVVDRYPPRTSSFTPTAGHPTCPDPIMGLLPQTDTIGWIEDQSFLPSSHPAVPPIRQPNDPPTYHRANSLPEPIPKMEARHHRTRHHSKAPNSLGGQPLLCRDINTGDGADRGAAGLTLVLSLTAAMISAFVFILVVVDLIGTLNRAQHQADILAVSAITASPLMGGPGWPDKSVIATQAKYMGSILQDLDTTGWPITITVTVTSPPQGILAPWWTGSTASGQAELIPPALDTLASLITPPDPSQVVPPPVNTQP